MVNMKEENVLKTGTTTVGILCKDGIVVAADKRTTLGGGYIVNKKSEKIIIIDDNIAITTAGNASDTQLLAKLLQSELKLKKIRSGKEVSVKEAANLLGRMVYQNIRGFSAIPGITQFVLAGKDSSGFHVYDIFVDGTVTEVDDYDASGSGAVYGAYPILDANYKKDMKLDEAVKLSVKCVNAAMQRDNASGDGIDIITVTKDGIKKLLTKELDIKITI